VSTRRSVYVEGFAHANPIPAACRIGRLVYSGSIQGTDPGTGRYPATLEEQADCMFRRVRAIVEAAGGGLEDIAKVTVWMRDRAARAAINAAWERAFPNPQPPPALEGEKLLECDFVAVLPG
jgi:2-iminobutanoate/2-iminopropanoate deaminase